MLLTEWRRLGVEDGLREKLLDCTLIYHDPKVNNARSYRAVRR
jgi:hypothetical protein